MKKRIISVGIMAVVLAFILSGCGMPKDVSISKYVIKKKTLSMVLNGDTKITKNYQGFIIIDTNLEDKYADQLKKVTVKNIGFNGTGVGTAVMYRYNGELDKGGMNAVYQSTKSGNVYNTYEYTKEQFSNFGFVKIAQNKYETRLQYIIMQAPQKSMDIDIARVVTLTMVYEFNNGDKIEKQVKASII